MINENQVSEQQAVNRVISELMTASVGISNPPQADQHWLREYNDLVACAEASRRMVELARRVAASECTVLLSGESGTGKEVLARFIHCNSPRADQPFIAINCAAIPENMLEAMLFGYERGAFTGAHTAHAGKFEQANCGTLLLDEVTEMPLALQAKLLRVLQEREVERIGSRHPIALDVRVLATTNRSLRTEVAAGRFREDLYYRLNVFPLMLSPLRERRDDVMPLAMRILNLRSKPGARIPAISADAVHSLLTYSWPGNVRELDNVMQRALILSSSPVIEQEHIQFETDLHAGQPAQSIRSEAAPLASSLETAERVLILDALRIGKGNRREVAEKLGISQRTLRYKLARLRESGVAVPAA